MAQCNAAVYVRISQDRGGEGLGVQRQEQDCRKLAERLGWKVCEVYTDNDASAYSGKPRPAYLRMLEDLESGRIEGILAWHPDRLHRSPLELERFITLVEQRNIQVHTVQAGHYDLGTPSGRAVARTVGAWARFESEHKGERIRRAREQQALAGRFHGGMRPYGFEKDGVTVRPSEAVEIVKAIEATIAGVSLRSIVRDLNQRGIPTATGKKWTAVTLRDIICRPRVAGLSTLRGEVVAPAQWPALVPEETWRAAKTILEDPDRRTTRGGTIRWLGSGLYICGVCGRAELRASTSGSKRKHAYRCRARQFMDGTGHVTRSCEDVDNYVETVLVERLKRAGITDHLADPGESRAEAKQLRTESAAISERLEQLAALFADGTISAAQLATGTGKLRRRADEIAAELAALGTRSPLSMVAGTPDIETLWFGTKPDRSDGLPLGARRAILDALATVTILRAPSGRSRNGIYFDPDYVRIDWKG